MKRSVIRRDEMVGATLQLGGTPITLDEYAITGLLAVAVGPRGNGKTNAGLLIAEQLSRQGWVSVLIDPENELESLYGDAVPDADALRRSLIARKEPIVVVNARDVGDFVPYGRVILEATLIAGRPTDFGDAGNWTLDPVSAAAGNPRHIAAPSSSSRP